MKKIRWGILGAGKIAKKFASDLRLVENGVLSAIASKDPVKGPEFRKEFSIPLLFDSYDQLAASSEVDAVYVATPHSFHFDHTMLCLRGKKAVLCEKAFALNYRQVERMTSFAKAQGVFLMEAFWTKFLPQFEHLHEVISTGKIGNIKLIQADFGFAAPQPLAQRLYDPSLGGGSLLDIGIYPVFLALSLLGKPVDVKALMTTYESGVDEQCAITMKFADGALAVLSSTFAADTPVEAMIAGTAGRVHMRNRFHNAVGTMEIVAGGESAQNIHVQREDGFGYQFEARHVGECVEKGLLESPIMKHSDSLLLMETLDRIRKECGIRYHVDDAEQP
jgi:predicted dehydrogenase